MKQVVLIRHGESQWNQENRFTGWVDVGLTERGIQEAIRAGRTLKEEGYTFDIAYTSFLKRAIKTLYLILEEMDLMWIPVDHHWRLNEQHTGALTGLNKAQTAERHGMEQTLTWRRGYDVPPPALSPKSEYQPHEDPRYADLGSDELPRTESLKDVMKRLLPYWRDTIAPRIEEGKRVIITAHGNCLRALIKHLDNISDEDIRNLNIPSAVPLVYELKDDLTPIRSFYLGDPEEVQKATLRVAEELKSK
jgi:2,3-bisphosphoglycerate-dependent phosphoglycerate mutase